MQIHYATHERQINWKIIIDNKPYNQSPYSLAMATRFEIVKLVCITAVLVMILQIWQLPNDRSSYTKDNKKYILLWTNPDSKPFEAFKNGMESFIERNCPVKNCFVTSDEKHLRDVSLYDAILFHGPDILKNKSRIKMPRKRLRYQKYVFVSTESPHYYVDCSRNFNNLFNWTWSYKLDSDIPFNYFTVKDRSGNVIGPRATPNWIDYNDMMPVADEVKKKLNNKSKAVAWLSSSCSGMNVAHELQNELELYELNLDIYGDCGELKCGDDVEDCWKMIEEEYYFYLAFEDFFAPDYVTEKLLNGLLHYTVPIVRGWTNYKRFIPGGAHLSIRELGPKEIALQINDAIENPEKYHRYFQWHNYYIYYKNNDIGSAPEMDGYCKLCEMLNDPEKMKTSICEQFDEWWNLPNICESRYYKYSLI